MSSILFVWQVEDRKKAIMDAERERREYILRKNQERDARLDTKRKNERSSIQFAFGSSTPRLLDPVEVNLVAPTTSYWGNRRSTSITNVSFGGNGATQISRRSSERELNDGAKKRATSAGGLDRPEGMLQMYTTPSFCRSLESHNVCFCFYYYTFVFIEMKLFEFRTYTHTNKRFTIFHLYTITIEVSSHTRSLSHTQTHSIIQFFAHVFLPFDEFFL